MQVMAGVRLEKGVKRGARDREETIFIRRENNDPGWMGAVEKQIYVTQ